MDLGEAVAAVERLAQATLAAEDFIPSCELPDAARRCIDALVAREHLPEQIATLRVEAPDAQVERYAKLMATKCDRCAELLRAKYAMLGKSDSGSELAAQSTDTGLLALLSCARKSPQHLWLQPEQLLEQEEPSQSLSELFATALSAQQAWPTPLELDMNNVSSSRKLQLPYKDERDYDAIVELHAKAQQEVGQVNMEVLPMLREHFESFTPGQNVVTLGELGQQHENSEEPCEPSSTLDLLLRVHASLVSSTDEHGAVQGSEGLQQQAP